MDFVFWIILIVLIVGVVWWLLNRSNSSTAEPSERVRTDGGLAGGSAAATGGLPGAAGFGKKAETALPTTADRAQEPTAPERPGHEEPDSGREHAGRRDHDAEWETQWSEASGSTPVAASPAPAADLSTGAAAALSPETSAAKDSGYVHHPEYTEPHAPTLPGAETAAAEAAVEAESGGAEMPSAHGGQEAASTKSAPAAEPAAAPGHEAASEPSGHLAAEEPYGAGSVSSGPDGSGPAGFAVKGDAGTMVFYEEGHPDYEETKADVWFESAAHAEAAGFRSPRRSRA